MPCLIISAMPGAGKSTLVRTMNAKVYDSDSQKFHYRIDAKGNYITKDGSIATDKSQRVENPNFRSDYMEEISLRCKDNEIVFVSAHQEIRDLLNESGRLWAYVAYESTIKAEVVNRIRSRESEQPNNIIADIVAENWDDWMADAKTYPAPLTVFLKSEQYLSDVIGEATEWHKQQS
jgi:tRNA uridine 5-carbamoylmethylation protein Kti12